MDKQKMMQQLMATFLEELDEHVRAFNQDLLALKKSPPAPEYAERFKTLFRTAHSLKGAARSVNVPLIEGACHRLEDILSAVRDRRVILGPELFTLLFSTVDGIEESGMRLREQQDLTDAPLSALLARLDAAVQGDTASAVQGKPITSEAPVMERPETVPSREASAVQGKPMVPKASEPLPIRSRPPIPEPAREAPVSVGSVRVPAEKLDTLLAHVGELLVAQRRVEARMADVAELVDLMDRWKTEWKRVERLIVKESAAIGSGVLTADRGSRRAALAMRQNGRNLRRADKLLEQLSANMLGDSRLLDQVMRPLDDEVRRVRMLPFSEACAGLDRMVHDLAQTKDKEVDLIVEGGSVEMDRSILEGLKDPLRHLIRNAIDHGVELPAQRAQTGKPRLAKVRVSAALRGSQVEVNVQDDGRGLDLDSILAQARRQNLEEPADERDLARMIFQPGFSTASIITDVSGRGVGLDVVKNRVEALHGTVDLSYTEGQGTCFTLIVPLTLTTLRAVLVTAGKQTFAFAGTNVDKMVQVAEADVRTVAGREVLSLGGEPVPFASLAAALNPASASEPPTGHFPVVVLSSGTTRMAFGVDELLTEQEILIKSLGSRIRRAPLVAGATLLPSGRIALVLNAANLIRTVLNRGFSVAQRRSEKKEAAANVRKRLLVVEDSMTTRTLMKSILEAAGYDVATVVDGQAGWQFLQEHDVDLLVSDVDMPNMNGFELAAAVRASKKWRALPTVLVTARETEGDKARGIEAGADAYIVKGAFDQRNLLEIINQLL